MLSQIECCQIIKTGSKPGIPRASSNADILRIKTYYMHFGKIYKRVTADRFKVRNILSADYNVTCLFFLDNG